MMEKLRFRIGAGGIGQEVIDLTDTGPVPQKSSEELRELRSKEEFFPDAQERFENTLEEHGYELVRELENGYQYPTLDEWVALKIERGEGWARAYPTFIRGKETGEMYFAKVRIKPKERQIGRGFAGEADVLDNMKGLPAPRLIEYIPEDEHGKRLEMLVLEAIKFSEGSVLMPQEWTPATAQNAVRTMKEMEKTSPDALPEHFFEEPSETFTSLLERTRYAQNNPSMQTVLEAVALQYEEYKQQVFVHGDMWPKNVIVGLDNDNPSIKLVDWELAGLGYKGQDAGRLWWGICANNQIHSEASYEFLRAYLEEPATEEQTARRAELQFGVAYEVLWRLEDSKIAILSNKKASESEIARARTELESIHKQAYSMLEMIKNTTPTDTRF